jgi:hypothetical protein
MSWCESCDRSTLELCSLNHCRRCCLSHHQVYDCDRFEGEWRSRQEQQQMLREAEE